MKISDRGRLARLDTALAQVEKFEQETVDRLNKAGFAFKNIGQARLMQMRIRNAQAAQRERDMALAEYSRKGVDD